MQGRSRSGAPFCVRLLAVARHKVQARPRLRSWHGKPPPLASPPRSAYAPRVTRLDHRRAIRPRFIVFLAFLLVAMLAGGGVNFDSPAQPVVRIAALAYLGWLAWFLTREEVRAMAVPLWLLAAIATICLLQLVPLPPGLWASLPGHHLYAEAAPVAGMTPPWRPLNLVPDRGWNALFGLIPPLAAVLGVASLDAAERARLLPILLGFIAVSLVVAGAQLGGSQPIGWYAASYHNDASGFFNNRNHQAVLVAIGIPMLAVWATESSRRNQLPAGARALFFATGLAGLLAMLPATGSRAGLFVGAVAVLAAGVLVVPRLRIATRRWRPNTRRAMLALTVVIILLIALMLYLSRDAEAVRRLTEMEGTSDPRLRAWRGAEAAIRDFFPFGIGLGAFESVYRQYEVATQLTYRNMNQVHSEPLSAVVEMGVAGALLLLGIVVAWGWAALRAWSAGGTTLQRLGCVALLLVGLGDLVDYPTRAPLMAVLAAVFAGWAAPALARRAAPSVWPSDEDERAPVGLRSRHPAI